ncbi:amino-acid N-acetyltransferase [Oceanimonas baumannii]|uniref:amino-acid N-acetyltransferase n=1 Tax=Oceanimonas baumannii TaxID=129578 RepID=UPI001D1982CB|nr:amino-acid N-acetyltransferase [Oceanimonas baumannii]MCC4263781.1 amino-acid N-acetyltransferase [Oceanimonas baumannii]
MRENDAALVKAFRQSSPYVNLHRGSTFVIMLGGEAIDQDNFPNIISDIALLTSLGIRLVIVFGARPQIDRGLTEAGLSGVFHKHTRVTDEPSFRVIKDVCGGLQMDITARLSMGLVNTPMQNARINVVTGNFVIAQPLGVDDGVDYIHSGRVRRIHTDTIHHQLAHGATVLISPIGFSVTGESFNLSSEELARRLAVELKADKLIGFCSQRGVLSENGEAIAELFPEQAEEHLQKLLEEGESLSGTARYLRAAISSCRGGVPRSHLVSYREDGALIQELFTRDGLGTQIVSLSAEQARQARIDDIGGILDLIRPMEEEGVLVRRSREQLEMEVDQFTIIEKDGAIIGCAALYPFPEEGMAEMACVAIHPDYRKGSRGDMLLQRIEEQARQRGMNRLFILTTRSIHWFQERGFKPDDVNALPMSKQKLYNFQRRSKIMVKALN